MSGELSQDGDSDSLRRNPTADSNNSPRVSRSPDFQGPPIGSRSSGTGWVGPAPPQSDVATSPEPTPQPDTKQLIVETIARMGVKQSKRSVDITETSTKGEIEGFGNEGKVEKLIDGINEKVAANGHVDGDLQNGLESLQNGVECIQNGEVAIVTAEKVTENSVDESPVEGVVNGQVENGEVEKPEETKKLEEKKEKKKDKKEEKTTVKRKFLLGFRNLSFSKKDKTKPMKKEVPAVDKLEETEAEKQAINNTPQIEEAPASDGIVVETGKVDEPPAAQPASSSSGLTYVVSKETETNSPPPEKLAKVPEDIPPPLPASPPPSEPLDVKPAPNANDVNISEPTSENPSGELVEISSSISSILTDKGEPMTELIKNVEQIAIETGQQIEEKATNLLKTVEESMRAAPETLSQTSEAQEAEETHSTGEAVPVVIPNVGSLTPPEEESTDKHEEGGGESLADVPKDELAEEVTEATEEVNPNLDVSATLPPPPPGVTAE